MSNASTIPNPTPGEILAEEFLAPMGLSQNALARAIHVSPRRINEILLGKRAVTADDDLKLARHFGLSQGFWLGLQTEYDLMEKRRGGDFEQTNQGSVADVRAKIQMAIDDPRPSIDEAAVRRHFEIKFSDES